MRIKFKVLDIEMDIEATPEEVISVADIFTPTQLVCSLFNLARSQVSMEKEDRKEETLYGG